MSSGNVRSAVPGVGVNHPVTHVAVAAPLGNVVGGAAVVGAAVVVVVVVTTVVVAAVVVDRAVVGGTDVVAVTGCVVGGVPVVGGDGALVVPAAAVGGASVVDGSSEHAAATMAKHRRKATVRVMNSPWHPTHSTGQRHQTLRTQPPSSATPTRLRRAAVLSPPPGGLSVTAR
jgi:hypothetical protein